MLAAILDSPKTLKRFQPTHQSVAYEGEVMLAGARTRGVVESGVLIHRLVRWPSASVTIRYCWDEVCS